MIWAVIFLVASVAGGFGWLIGYMRGYSQGWQAAMLPGEVSVLAGIVIDPSLPRCANCGKTMIAGQAFFCTLECAAADDIKRQRRLQATQPEIDDRI